MRKILIILLISMLGIIFISCDEDNPINPISSELNGTWKANLIFGPDTIHFTCNINEANSVITGYGDLYAYHVQYNGNSKVSESLNRKGDIKGSYIGTEVKINFSIGDSNYFIGNLMSDKKTMVGTMYVYFISTDYHGEYLIDLKKQ